MKKLIPMFLAAAFAFSGALGSTTVLANNIESMETTNTQIAIHDWPLEIDGNIINIILENSDNIYRFIPINGILENFGLDFNLSDGKLEITDFTLSNYQALRELNPIIEAIDMENINLDEWVSSNVLSTVLGGAGTSFDMVTISLQSQPEIPEGMDRRYWFENHFSEPIPLLSSVIGCNAEEFRSILFNDISDDNWHRMHDFLFNIEDVLESGMLSDAQVERLFIEKEREEARRSGQATQVTEAELEEWQELRFSNMVSDIPNLSTEQLKELIEILENQI